MSDVLTNWEACDARVKVLEKFVDRAAADYRRERPSAEHSEAAAYALGRLLGALSHRLSDAQVAQLLVDLL